MNEKERAEFEELPIAVSYVKTGEKIVDLDYLKVQMNAVVKPFIEKLISSRTEKLIDENTSDGYHTFKELYEFRKLYNAAFFNEIPVTFANVHKSKRHHDGEECFGGGWFIVMATLPTGQISNHYELKDWDLFKCEERERADEWDGHTAKDVADRLKAFLLKEEFSKD